MLRPTLLSVAFTAILALPAFAQCRPAKPCRHRTPAYSPGYREVRVGDSFPIAAPVAAPQSPPSTAVPGYDPALCADAAASNAAMRARGFAHHWDAAPHNKCVGYGTEAQIWAMWRADPAHARWLSGRHAYGYHYDGTFATLSAY